eukprot:TRINITY_DN3612_c0_g1_i7.p1 TRINITY_DN3612_c0_g1~~TRINITY_DN3612_c0_g1_i7.p1  ORF type:complete len:247 (+),score=52.80 TRINITY_DN3612_c0_g1_i7:108-848(+)
MTSKRPGPNDYDGDRTTLKKPRINTLGSEDSVHSSRIPIRLPFGKSYADYSNHDLKDDHDQRPIWVCPDGHIFLETFSPIYRYAYDFIISIAEPVSRPAMIHEYVLTPFSLRAAVTVELKTEDIIHLLRKLCKTKELPSEVINYIKKYTMRYGLASSVLKDNRCFIETTEDKVARELMNSPNLFGKIWHAKETDEGTKGGQGKMDEDVVEEDEDDLFEEGTFSKREVNPFAYAGANALYSEYGRKE